MDTVNNDQADFIAELINNFVHNFPIAGEDKKRIARKKVFKDITNLKRTFKFRKAKIKQAKKEILLLLDNYHKQLSTLLTA